MYTMSTHKVAIIGAGAVGSTTAYTLILKNVTTEILLVDVDQAFLEGQVLDLSDTASVSSCKVKKASLKEAGQADIILVTAGAKQKEGESRTSLVGRNYCILQSVMEGMKPIRSDAIMMMVSNPVDTLTQIAQELSGLPMAQVFGSGTYLDTTRLRVLLSHILDVDSRSIHAYVLGEHGDSQFIPWSTASIAGRPLIDIQEFQKMDKELVRIKVAGKALKIIKLKGATHFGIGACASDLCESIILNKNQIRPLSVFVPRLGCYLSMPAKLGTTGIKEIFEIPLTEAEEELLQASALSIMSVLSRV